MSDRDELLFDSVFNMWSRTANDEKSPNLDHLTGCSAYRPPQFVLVPGFETLSLFLVGLAFGDSDGIIASLFFTKEEWSRMTTFGNWKLKGEISLGRAMTLFLANFHHLLSRTSLKECLSLSSALSDRSATLFEELRKFESLQLAPPIFSEVLSGPSSLSTFESFKKDLDVHFFTTESGFEQTLIFCDGLMGGPELLEAFSVYPGRQALFRDSEGRLMQRLSEKRLRIIRNLSDDNGSEDAFCLWAIGTIEGRPTLALFLKDNFYYFSDRTTTCYTRDSGTILTELRVYILCYAMATSVGICLEDKTHGSMQPGYERAIYDDVHELTEKRVEEWSGQRLTFSDFVEQSLQFPACFVTRCTLPADRPMADYAFALVLSDGAPNCPAVAAFAQHLFPPEKGNPASQRECRKQQQEFTEAVAGLVNSYVDFTNFLYHLIDFFQTLDGGNETAMRSSLSSLVAFMPFEIAFLFEVTTLFLIQLAADRPVLNKDIGESLAIVVGPEYIADVAGTMWDAGDVVKWSRKQPNQAFQQLSQSDPLLVKDAVAKLGTVINAHPALDAIASASVGRAPHVMEAYRIWARNVILRPAIVF
jgi:hypothetical protein